MKGLTSDKIEQKIESLQRQKKAIKRQEREAEKKRKQRLYYKYFPDILNINPGNKSENAKNFAPLEQFFDMLASDKMTMELFKECLSCTQDNQSNV